MVPQISTQKISTLTKQRSQLHLTDKKKRAQPKTKTTNLHIISKINLEGKNKSN